MKRLFGVCEFLLGLGIVIYLILLPNRESIDPLLQVFTLVVGMTLVVVGSIYLFIPESNNPLRQHELSIQNLIATGLYKFVDQSVQDRDGNWHSLVQFNSGLTSLLGAVATKKQQLRRRLIQGNISLLPSDMLAIAEQTSKHWPAWISMEKGTWGNVYYLEFVIAKGKLWETVLVFPIRGADYSALLKHIEG